MSKEKFQKILGALCCVCLLFAVLGTPVFGGEAVNINTATVAELETLPSVGPVIAKRIVEYRDKHPFTSTEDIQEVKGIGAKTYEKIEGDLAIE